MRLLKQTYSYICSVSTGGNLHCSLSWFLFFHRSGNDLCVSFSSPAAASYSLHGNQAAAQVHSEPAALLQTSHVPLCIQTFGCSMEDFYGEMPLSYPQQSLTVAHRDWWSRMSNTDIIDTIQPRLNSQFWFRCKNRNILKHSTHCLAS